MLACLGFEWRLRRREAEEAAAAEQDTPEATSQTGIVPSIEADQP